MAEYLIYSAIIVLCIALLCLALRRIAPVRSERTRSKSQAARSRGSVEKAPPVRVKATMQVPTPWGWPGSDSGHAFTAKKALSGAEPSSPSSNGLHRWVDHLVSTKQTTHDDAYRLHCETCIRALLEDRFHNPSQTNDGGARSRTRPNQRRAGTVRGGMSPSTRQASAQIHTSTERSASREAGRDIQGEQSLSGLRTPWGW